MKYILLVLPLLMAGGMCSCSDEGGVPTENPRRTGPIFFGRSHAQVEWVNGQGGTRAEGEIDSEIPDDIGVFAFGNGPNTTYIFKNQRVYYKEGPLFKHGENDYEYEWKYREYVLDGNGDKISDGNGGYQKQDNLWPYSTDPNSVVPRYWDEMKYRFFGYSPWTRDKDVEVASENYDGFNQFIWDNIPGFSDKDYVLSNEIVEVDNTGKTQKTEDAVHFSMRHILSRIRFFFKMKEKYYRTLRKIKLNSITIITAGKVKKATFNFKNNSWDATVHWSNEQIGDDDPVPLYNKTNAEYFIPTEYDTEPFASVYVYPQTGFNEIKMSIDYSVYDSKGVKTRDGSVINIVTLKTPWTLQAGYYYNVKINIVPDYLYVLSDNDHDYDGYCVIEDSN